VADAGERGELVVGGNELAGAFGSRPAHGVVGARAKEAGCGRDDIVSEASRSGEWSAISRSMR
jgi:hypothetical protein